MQRNTEQREALAFALLDDLVHETLVQDAVVRPRFVSYLPRTSPKMTPWWRLFVHRASSHVNSHLSKLLLGEGCKVRLPNSEVERLVPVATLVELLQQ